VFWFTDALSPAQLVELARTEELGYAALWYPEVAGFRLLRTAGMGQIHQFTGLGQRGEMRRNQPFACHGSNESNRP
jgi:hypothetical protein